MEKQEEITQKQIITIEKRIQKKVPSEKFQIKNWNYLKSKKHTVIQAIIENNKFLNYNNDIIIKIFNSSVPDFDERFNDEIYNYGLLMNLKPMGIFIPKRLYFTKHLIIYEYIASKPLFYYINRLIMTSQQIDQLVHTLGIIYNNNLGFKECRLRNFIWSKNKKLYIVDFEEININSDDIIYSNLGELLSSFLDFTPGILDLKFENVLISTIYINDFIQKFLKFYPTLLNKDYMTKEGKPDYLKWIQLIIGGLQATVKRRKLELSKPQWNSIREFLFEKFMKEHQKSFF